MAAYCYTFMKLLSYHQVNKLCRREWLKNGIRKSTYKAVMTNIYVSGKEKFGSNGYHARVASVIQYPKNLSISNVLLWAYIPTYYYRHSIQRGSRIKWSAVCSQVLFILVGSEAILNIMHYCVEPRLKYYHYELGFFAFRDTTHMLEHYTYALVLTVSNQCTK